MSELVGEGVIHIRTDDTGVDVAGAGAKAGKGYTSGFLGSLKGLALGIGSVIAAREVIGFAKDALAEGREAQKVGAATEQIIKSTGATANVTAGHVSDLATSLSLVTGQDDEAIQSGANLLLTFKNVANQAGKNNDIFDRTVAATQDVAAAGFGSIESASKSLGKALNDPVKGITALGRAGITFTAAQQDQIKSMVANNDLLGAQKIILGEVESQVGGVAEATATSGEKASVAWANLKEQIGTALIPTLDSLEETFATKVVPALSDTIAGTNTAGQVIRSVVSGIGDAIGFVRDVLSSDTAGGFLDQVVEVAKTGLPIVVDAFHQIIDVVLSFATQVLPVMADTFQNVVLPALQQLGAYLIANVLPVFMDVGAFIANDLVPTLASIAVLIYGTVYPAIVQIVTTVATQLKPVFDQLIATFRADVLPTLSDLVTTIRTQLIPALQPIIEVVLQVVGGLLRLAATVLGVVLPPVIQLAGFIIRNLVPVIAAIIVHTVQVIAIFARLASSLAGPLQALGNLYTGFVQFQVKLLAGIAAIPGKIIDMAGDMVSAGKRFVGGLLSGIRDAASGVGGVVADIASSVYDAIKKVVNGAIDLINSGIPNSIGKGPLTIDLPDNPIPHLARGTSSWPGGWSWVGEEGPELVNLPRGAQVVPAGPSAALAGTAGATATIQVVLPTGDPEAAGMAVMNRLVSLGFVGG